MKNYIMIFTLLLLASMNVYSQAHQTMLYGIVSKTFDCKNAQSAFYRDYKVISSNNSGPVSDAFKLYLQNKFPGAEVRVSTSDIDYSAAAKFMRIISYEKPPEYDAKCLVKVYVVAFGKTEQEALDRAIKQKNDYSSTTTAYIDLANEVWR